MRNMFSYEESSVAAINTNIVHPPKDRFRLVYIIFFIAGAGTLIPWQFFVTAKGYFFYKLRNVTFVCSNSTAEDSFTEMQNLFENATALCAMIPNSISVLLHLLLQKRFGLNVRFFGGLTAMLLMFVITLIFVHIDTDSHQETFFGVTMLTVVVMNCGAAFLQGSLFGIAAVFPPAYVSAVMEGQAMAGVLASVANILSLLLVSDPLMNATGYFSVAVFFIILGGGLFWLLSRLKFSQHYIRPIIMVASTDPIRTDSCATDDEIQSTRLSSNSSLLIKSELDNDFSQLNKSRSSLCQVIRRIFPVALCVFMVFAVTLTLFPGVLARIQSMEMDAEDANVWPERYFTPVVAFLLMNFGDWIGRMLAGIIRTPSSSHPKILVALSFLRIIFIPLLLLCNVRPRPHLPVFLAHDAYPMILVLLLGLSNGYVGTLAMMHAASYVDPLDAETVGASMTVFLSGGVAVGVLLSFALVYKFDNW